MFGRTNLGWKKAGVVLALVLAAGCMQRPTLIPNNDPQLRRTTAQFSADSAKRFPFKTDTPKGDGLTTRSQVDYTMKIVDVVNLSGKDWSNVEVWVNRKYVVFVPEWKASDRNIKRIAFEMLYDDSGNYMPTDYKKEKVKQVELVMDGKVYDVPVKLAD